MTGAVFAFAVTACSLIYGPTDAEFSSGKPDGGRLPDGAPVTSSSSSSSSSGGAMQSDSGFDGAVVGPFSCPPKALLCDDFEDPATNPFTSDGDIQTVNGGFNSAHALAATLQKNKDQPQVNAQFNPTTATGTFDFWFKLDSGAPDPDDHFRLGSVLWGDGCDWQLSTSAFLTAEGLTFDISSYDVNKIPASQCGPVKFGSINPIIPASDVVDGNWHHITIVTDARTSHVTVASTLDQLPVFNQSFDLDRTDPPTTVNVAIGVPCVQTTGGCFGWDGADWRVLYDDVTFTLPSP